jgi:hypothetical protein
VLVLGRAAAGAGASTDWFTVPVQDGPARKTGAFAALAAQRLVFTAWLTDILPLEWRTSGRVVFAAGPATPETSGRSPSPADTCKAPLSASHKLPATSCTPLPRRTMPATAWRIPVWCGSPRSGARRSTPTGNRQRASPQSITIDEPSSQGPSLSADGRYLAYLSNQLGARSVRVRDLVSGKAITLVSSPSGFFNPRISGDGATVAYSDPSGNIFSVPRAGGAVETLCTGCGTTMAVSADGKRISYEPAESEDLTYYDVERKARVTVAQRPGDSILTDGRFSPDGKWMAFHALTKQTTAQVFVVPIDGGLPVPRQQWIAITDGGSEEIEPAWSPNGELLYFLSDRDGFRCIWARRLNATGKQPAGAAFAVRHFHRARRSLRRITRTTGLIGLSVAPGRMVFAFGELTGNIWLEEKVP